MFDIFTDTDNTSTNKKEEKKAEEKKAEEKKAEKEKNNINKEEQLRLQQAQIAADLERLKRAEFFKKNGNES